MRGLGAVSHVTQANSAWWTVHRENRIDRAPLEPDGEAVYPIDGKPPDEILPGPTSAAWGLMPGEYGRVAYVTTDGGLVAACSLEQSRN